jgi:hypothetical protein
VKLRQWARKARRTSRQRAVWLAWFISGLTALLGSLFLLLLILNSADPKIDTYDYWGATVVIAMIFPVVGALIVTRYPSNALGWVFCVGGFFVGAGDFASQYATYTLLVEPGSLPGGLAVAWFSSYAPNIGFFSLVIGMPLLFPDGRPPSRRWWPIAWLAGGAIAVGTVSFAFMPGPLEDIPSVNNPLGIEDAGATLASFVLVGDFIFLSCCLASVVSLILRFRRSRGTERQQLKWFTYAVLLIPLSLLGNTLLPDFAWLIGGIGVASVPIAIGIAILKHRLYDIDLLINRTLVYALLTATLVALYFGGIVVLQRLFVVLTGERSTLAVVASTLLIAALFSPIRRHIQGFIDRRFYRRKYDARKTLDAFSAKLRDETDLEAVNGELVGVARETMQPAHVSVWLRPHTAYDEEESVTKN